MTTYTVFHARATAAAVAPTVHAALDMSCLLHDERGQSCGQPVRFVVDEWDLDETPRRHVIQFGACADHADLYR